MRNVIMALLLSISALAGVACRSGAEAPGPGTEGTIATSASHAPAHAVPGSHEDWCGEHQVPESMCTRCNPKLVAAFKATGDWCPEHGLPESQCRICNPDLKITRPPQSQGR